MLDVNGCKLTCEKFATLWPRPTGKVILSKSLVKIVPKSVSFDLDQMKTKEPFLDPIVPMLEELEGIFKQYMYSTHPRYDQSKPRCRHVVVSYMCIVQ